MVALDACPICDSLVFSTNIFFSCSNCETSFSLPSEGVIVLDRVGMIMGKMVSGYHEMLSQIRMGHESSGFPNNHL